MKWTTVATRDEHFVSGVGCDVRGENTSNPKRARDEKCKCNDGEEAKMWTSSVSFPNPDSIC